MIVEKEFRFEAGHYLTKVAEGHKCARQHGHSYRFVVAVCGEVDERGFVIDYAELAAIVQPILDEWDHQNLNDILPIETTAENLAIIIGGRVQANLPVGLFVYEVRMYETPTSCAIYRGIGC